MENEKQKIAMFIDADNATAKKIEKIRFLKFYSVERKK